MNYLKDFKVDEDGDLVVGSNGDLSVATATETAIQDIVMRIRTNNFEVRAHPTFGANMQAKFGEPNNLTNGEWLKNSILNALTRDSRFSYDEINVEVVPTSKVRVMILVTLNSVAYDAPVMQGARVLTFSWNYNEGTIERITD